MMNQPTVPAPLASRRTAARQALEQQAQQVDMGRAADHARKPQFTLWVAVGGVLLSTGLAGLMLNQTLLAPRPNLGTSEAAGRPFLASTSGVGVVSDPAAGAVTPAPSAPAGLAPVVFTGATPPPDPFLPTAPDPLPGAAPATRVAIQPFSGALMSQAPPPALPRIGSLEPMPVGSTSPTRTATPAASAAPAASDFVLTGIVDADPALAVFRHQGQSHFLKIGDRLADTWRLEEIRERSAILKNGEKRVELTIQGGSAP